MKARGSSSCAIPKPRSWRRRWRASSASSAWSSHESRRARHRSGPATRRERETARAATGDTSMNVLMISPGYPEEMIHFTRGLAEVGAQVIGVGDQHEGALDPVARRSLAAYLRVDSLWDEDALAADLRTKLRG